MRFGRRRSDERKNRQGKVGIQSTRGEVLIVDDGKLLYVGSFGALIAALCCFTPILVITLGAVGLSAAVGWLDYALIPALAIFVGIVVYALVRRRRARSE